MGQEFEYPSSEVDIGTTKTAILITHAQASTNVTGADHACKRVLIKAFTENTGIAWIDFDNEAVQDACYPLDPGETIAVPLTNTNKVNALFEVAGEKCCIVYSN